MAQLSLQALFSALNSLQAGTSREEILALLPDLLRSLIPFDNLRISREASTSAANSSTFGFAIRSESEGEDHDAVFIERSHSNPFSSDERHLLTAIADQTSAALTRIDLHKRQTQAELILKINNEIASNLELRPLLRSITQTLRSTLGCDFVVVSVPDGDSGQMHALALDFPTSRGVFQEGARLPIEGSVVGSVYRTRERKFVRNPDELDPILRARVGAEGITEGCFVHWFIRIGLWAS